MSRGWPARRALLQGQRRPTRLRTFQNRRRTLRTRRGSATGEQCTKVVHAHSRRSPYVRQPSFVDESEKRHGFLGLESRRRSQLRLVRLGPTQPDSVGTKRPAEQNEVTNRAVTQSREAVVAPAPQLGDFHFEACTRKQHKFTHTHIHLHTYIHAHTLSAEHAEN